MDQCMAAVFESSEMFVLNASFLGLGQ